VRVYGTVEALKTVALPGGWVERAACRGLDSELFFPGRGGSDEAARAVCAGCAVTVDCLDYAVANRITEGLWGGRSERERRRLRRRLGLNDGRRRDDLGGPIGRNGASS
jgi:WhiB family redox-sensing transcriptional regulator